MSVVLRPREFLKQLVWKFLIPRRYQNPDKLMKNADSTMRFMVERQTNKKSCCVFVSGRCLPPSSRDLEVSESTSCSSRPKIGELVGPPVTHHRVFQPLAVCGASAEFDFTHLQAAIVFEAPPQGLPQIRVGATGPFGVLLGCCSVVVGLLVCWFVGWWVGGGW